VGGTVASWLMHLTEEPTVRIQALAGDIVLCFSTNHFTLTVPLSTQVYEWELVNLMLGKGGGGPCHGLASHPGGSRKVEILLVALCY